MSCGYTTQLIGRDTSCHSSHVSLRQQLRTGGCTGDTQALGTLRHWGILRHWGHSGTGDTQALGQHSGTGPTLRHWGILRHLGHSGTEGHSGTGDTVTHCNY